jgi:endonuclease G
MSRSDIGYRKDFLGRDHLVKLPVLNAKQRKDVAKFDEDKHVLDYIHYSAVMSKTRRFAYFTAVNIDGRTWRDNPRNGRWKRDKRIIEQFGDELYDAEKSEFDKGHLVRREDPEWGDPDVALRAGESTFRFPNCVPQHRKLNRSIWEELESNILHKGANDQQMRISVFTGPVLSESDGVFVSPVNGEEVRIPNLFWKVVTWVKTGGKLYAVGFLQSQEKFLLEGGIIRKLFVPARKRLRALRDEDFFEHLKFRDGKTYQVRIEEIESLTGLEFDWPGVIRPFNLVEPVRIRSRKLSRKLNHRRTQEGFMPQRRRLSLLGMELG